MPVPHFDSHVPAVDERLVMPESGYEILGGQVFAVSPAYEPHARRHFQLCALLEAFAAEGFLGACDMLTRTSAVDDFAPDGSVYPEARDPMTGGRQLEVLAFEVVSTESLAHAGRKAEKLVARGVRRVFAIDVERARVLEWSSSTDAWEILASDGAIEDPALVIPLPIHELVVTANADDAVARALLAKRNPVLVDALEVARAAATARAIIAFLDARGLAPSGVTRAAILRMRDPAVLERWLARAAICASADEVVDDEPR